MKSKIIAMVMSVFAAGSLSAAWDKTFSPSENVIVKKVTFKNRVQIDVVGDMYIPKNIDSNQKYMAIVVGHPFGGVKEQTSGLHAQKLAEMGYVTLAFDASHYGESGGEPRYIEVPSTRVEDFSAAVDFLSNHALVDENKIGVIGICGGGGYAISAAQIDHRIKAVATISMYDMGRARRQGLGDTVSYEQRMKTLDEVGKQRIREFRGEPRRDIAAIPEKLSEIDTENTREFYDYYRTSRGAHPNSTTSYSFTSLAPMMNFFPFVQIETISPRPILMIVGERAVSAYFSEDAYKKAAEPKELFVVPGASHVDMYDKPEYTKISLEKLNEFFSENLNKQPKQTERVSTPVQSTTEIFPKGNIIKSSNFIGNAYLQYLMTNAKIFDCTIGIVTFESGSRNSWHSHPGGQILLATGGEGYYQEKGKPIQHLKIGDVVEIYPNVIHWHGATPTSEFTHLAVGTNSKKGSVKWMDPVTDEEYRNDTSQKDTGYFVESGEDKNRELIDLSKNKWRWMAEQNVDSLDDLFHDEAVFVHMGGTMTKKQELDIIKSGGIQYKHAEILETSVRFIGETAVILDRIRLTAVVGGNEVVNPFMVTEVYIAVDGKWKLGSLSFTRLMGN